MIWKKTKDILEEKTKYEKLKKEAYGSMKAASLVLSKPKKNGLDTASSVQNSNAFSPIVLPDPLASLASLEKSSSILSRVTNTTNKTSGTTNLTTKLRLVKKACISRVSEAEMKAFNETAIAMELYLELKEEYKALQLDCDFREDYQKSKVCKEIVKLCELDPLKVAPHHTERIIDKMTETETTETTTTTTMTTATTTIKLVNGEKVTKQCTLVRTIDKWVTSTSLHMSTSIVTSTVTLTSMRKYNPTKSINDSSKETQKEEEEVKPNEGMKMEVPDIIKITLLGVIIMGML